MQNYLTILYVSLMTGTYGNTQESPQGERPARTEVTGAAETATPGQLAKLHSIVTEMEHTLADGNLLGYVPLAGRLHRVLVEAAAHEFIAQFLNVLQAPRIRHQLRSTLVPGRKDEALAEHRKILAYVEHHDAVGAEHAMRHHMAQLRRSLQPASHLPIS
jgi:DNA-binding GntR family transcriptional regulator